MKFLILGTPHISFFWGGGFRLKAPIQSDGRGWISAELCIFSSSKLLMEIDLWFSLHSFDGGYMGDHVGDHSGDVTGILLWLIYVCVHTQTYSFQPLLGTKSEVTFAASVAHIRVRDAQFAKDLAKMS